MNVTGKEDEKMMVKRINRSVTYHLWSLINRIRSRLGVKIFKFSQQAMKAENYEMIQKAWNEKERQVHGDISSVAIEGYVKIIADLIELEEQDVFLDIGAGEGSVDTGLLKFCRGGYGFDFAESKIEIAKQKNKKVQYWQQSFLEPYKNMQPDITKMFSFGVVQYCKPKDIELFLKNSLLAAKENGSLYIGHLDIPDIANAYRFYHNFYGISEVDYMQNLNTDRLIFSDGSYWHDLISMKNITQDLAKEMQMRVKVRIESSYCDYRSHLHIYINERALNVSNN